jgi:hypothetical protein
LYACRVQYIFQNACCSDIVFIIQDFFYVAILRVVLYQALTLRFF